MVTKKKNSEEFDFGFLDKKEDNVDKVSYSDISKQIDEMLEKKKGSRSSAEEQSRRFEEVLDNPPEPGYGKIELWKAETTDGKLTNALINPEDGETKAIKPTGEIVKVNLLEPLLTLDLYDLFEGQLAEASIDVIPNLMDEKVQIELNERKEYKPEKAKKDLTDWYWLLYILMFVPLIVIGILYFTGIW